MPSRSPAWPVLAGAVSAALLPLPARAGPGAAPDYNRDVKPVLAKNCYACHGPDQGQRKAGLRLDQRDGATRPRKRGAAVVPGKPDESLLLARVTAAEESKRMPPPEAGPPLTPEQVATLRRWVEQGAPYAEHWSFVKPRRPPLPAVRDAAWPRNGVDHFILARLEQEGLRPSPEADRFVLLRRASLDLRGLPPTPAEVDAFARDTGPGAYERVVGRFLADPAYGERWARVWLDLARYADSAGFGSDPLRPNVWRWRDWVIDAFNRNLPYDRFTVEQLAGDLLPSPTLEQRVATAFHRNTMTNTEGGTDREEFRVAAIKDRVDTTMQVWMGLTMGCAKCHTHKYDPISHQEYYRFYALFNQTADNDQPDESPTMPAPTPAQQKMLTRIEARLAELRRRLDTPTPALAGEQSRWEAGLRPAAAAAPRAAATFRIAASLGRPPAFVGARAWPSGTPVRGPFALALTPQTRRLAVPTAARDVLDMPPEKRTKEQQDLLARHFRTVAPSLQPLRDEVARLEKERPEIPALPVMAELPPDKHRPTRVMLKGNFLDPGEAVGPGLPAAFPPLPPGAPLDRLGVAQWLVSPDNPLTARVAVNRYWAQLFGKGLVETEEDFGTQGEPPSHPELLDWLAVEFRESGWDTKALLRLIVTSATYRQSSRVTPELLAKDPRNRLLARAPRYRLEAETVRDQALALGGLLSRKVGGPSVFPPQPDGLWQAAFNGQRTWPTSRGEDRHRRGLYTFWRRTVPYPSMATFDAPSREVCAVRRVRSNTPLQAFVTLNDPAFVEAAQALARRLMREGGTAPEERVRYGLRLCLARPAQPEQVEPLLELYQTELATLRADPKRAQELAAGPLGPLPDGVDEAEAAAWTVVANVLLNMDGVLTKG
jgi:hypothetical protein